QPTWAKITRTVHGKGQRVESKDQYSPHGLKSPEQSTGRVNVLSPRTNVLICVLMDGHGRPVCGDGHTRTTTDFLCVLTDTHRRPVCADGHPRTHGQPRTSCVCWRTPTDVLCVLNRQPTWAKITRTVHGKGQRVESKAQCANMCTDRQPRTSSTDVLCVLTNTHGRPVCVDGHPQTQPKWAKITRTIHWKGQRAESKDQRADMCTDGQPRTSCSTGRASELSPRTTVLKCVLMDSCTRPVCADKHTDIHGRPVCADRHTRTQPTWAKITQTVHGKSQRAESKDQHADMCTDGQPQTSCVC
ncbi:unnamed protein product, partial [Brassica rapa]